jgi:cytochrome d ubiquinol oxidase subunit I
MTTETLSRIQFAFTVSYHYIYPPISMGLGIMLVFFGIIYLRTHHPLWRQLSVFWIKVYAIVFAMGVATGIVQEFEFGMNWATYSRFVGNIFGSLLAAEGIFAFFLEGGFLGLMLFGGSRLGPRLWLLATSLVVFGAHFSALWIVMANSWMQTPAGYALQQSPHGTIAVMTSFASVVFTPSFLANLCHVWVSAWLVGAALVLSVSAWYLLRHRSEDLAKAAIKVAMPWFALLAIVQVFITGSWIAIIITNYQGTKLAAMEGLWPKSQSCAPLVLFGWVNESSHTTVGPAIPCLLSYLAYFNIHASVTGIENYSASVLPPIQVSFQAYHLMIDLGMLFILIGLLGMGLFFWGRRLFSARWMLGVLVASVFLTEVATLAGWWTSEFGRQPWIVFGVLQTSQAVSPGLSPAQVVFSLGTFFGMYAALLLVFLFLLNARIQKGPEPLEEEKPPSDLPDTFREVFRRRPPLAAAPAAAQLATVPHQPPPSASGPPTAPAAPRTPAEVVPPPDSQQASPDAANAPDPEPSAVLLSSAAPGGGQTDQQRSRSAITAVLVAVTALVMTVIPGIRSALRERRLRREQEPRGRTPAHQ